jgi:type IV pilus assembly protein PilA
MKVINPERSNTGGRTMKSFMKIFYRESKGFTLVELLIVIAILGVLAAAVLPNVTGLVGSGKTEAAPVNINVITFDIAISK